MVQSVDRLGGIQAGNGGFLQAMLEAEHVRRSLMEIQMKNNVIVYIRNSCMLMYKVPTMTQHEAFLLLM